MKFKFSRIQSPILKVSRLKEKKVSRSFKVETRENEVGKLTVIPWRILSVFYEE